MPAVSYELLLTEWAKKGFIPEILNVVAYTIGKPSLTEVWLQRLNPNSSISHTGYFEYPMNLLHPPYLQLQFGQSCTLPIVRTTKYGLGPVEDLLILTNCTCGNKALNHSNISGMQS